MCANRSHEDVFLFCFLPFDLVPFKCISLFGQQYTIATSLFSIFRTTTITSINNNICYDSNTATPTAIALALAAQEAEMEDEARAMKVQHNHDDEDEEVYDEEEYAYVQEECLDGTVYTRPSSTTSRSSQITGGSRSQLTGLSYKTIVNKRDFA